MLKRFSHIVRACPWLFGLAWGLAVCLPVAASGQGVQKVPGDRQVATVIELFTSMACANSARADSVLAELADDPSLLVLTYHVDYLNMGKRQDPFALPDGAQRQRRYKELLALSYLYTPQMVINGEHAVVGASKSGLLDQLALVDSLRDHIAFEREDDTLHIHLPPKGQRAHLHLLDLDFLGHRTLEHAGMVPGAGNTKRKAAHIVVGMRESSVPDDQERLSIRWEPEHFNHEGRAVLLQDHNSGRILAGFWQYRDGSMPATE